MDISDLVGRLICILGLILINGFFVTAEFSIVAVRRSRISQLVKEGDASAQTVQSLQRSLDRLLSTTQIGITLSSLALGWIGFNLMSGIIEESYQYWFNPSLNPHLLRPLSFCISFCLIAYLQIVLGELCPKSFALLYPEKIASTLAYPSLVISKFFTPLIWILNQSTRTLLKLFGVKNPVFSNEINISIDEVQFIIQNTHSTPELPQEERELINNIFELRDVSANQIMTLRTDIQAIPTTATLNDILQLGITSNFSRYPVIEETLDDIVGIIELKDISLAIAEGKKMDTSLLPLIKRVPFLLETKGLSELFSLFSEGEKMVIIVDEFGGTAGLITFQDILAELIKNPLYQPMIQPNHLGNNSFILPAKIDIEEVNERYNLNLPIQDEYQSLGGFLLFQWQKIPQQGDKLIYQNLEFIIVEVNGPRLEKVQIIVNR